MMQRTSLLCTRGELYDHLLEKTTLNNADVRLHLTNRKVYNLSRESGLSLSSPPRDPAAAAASGLRDAVDASPAADPVPLPAAVIVVSLVVLDAPMLMTADIPSGALPNPPASAPARGAVPPLAWDGNNPRLRGNLPSPHRYGGCRTSVSRRSRYRGWRRRCSSRHDTSGLHQQRRGTREGLVVATNADSCCYFSVAAAEPAAAIVTYGAAGLMLRAGSAPPYFHFVDAMQWSCPQDVRQRRRRTERVGLLLRPILLLLLLRVPTLVPRRCPVLRQRSLPQHVPSPSRDRAPNKTWPRFVSTWLRRTR